MDVKNNLMYTKSHEWVDFTGETSARIGLSDFAQSSLGSLVFAELPEVGDEVAVGESFGDIESVKSVSDIISPVSGVVSAVNDEILDTPEKINEDPYRAWLVEVNNISRKAEELMDAEAYKAFCDEEV